jgi:lipid-binding SYLF domain-containing protein
MKNLLVSMLMISAFVIVNSTIADTKDVERSRQLVEDAAVTAKMFTDDPNMSFLHANLAKAEGVLIIPKHGRAALIVGGAGGSGVLLKRRSGNQWSYPAFYTMGSGSIGLQAGGGVSEIVLMVMTKRGMDSLLDSSFKLGLDTSVAAGPIGIGAKAQTADIQAFARTKGMFAGVSVDGSVIKVRDDYNSAYYSKDITPAVIIDSNEISNPHAEQLRTVVAAMARVGANN